MTFAVLVLAMVSCNSGGHEQAVEKKTKKKSETNSGELIHDGQEQSEVEETSLARTILPSDGKLACKLLEVDEYEIPHSEVTVLFNAEPEVVALCNSCQSISKSDYTQYDIPKNAKSACGGWFAGGGDYYYSLVKEDGTVEVYSGWQDEGQMEDSDTSFHWELRKVLK